jgi:F0F1-type ATP synthase membrane subunit c/vacuolar-type H+-ATPase subunit K
MQHSAQSSVDQFARFVFIIAAALAASVVIYMVIAWIVVPTIETAGMDSRQFQLIALILVVLSIGHLAAAHVVFSSRVRSAAKLPTSEERLESYRISFIIAFALREAVAIYGLVLSFLGGDIRWALGFGVVALMSMLLAWPKKTAIVQLGSEVPPIG